MAKAKKPTPGPSEPDNSGPKEEAKTKSQEQASKGNRFGSNPPPRKTQFKPGQSGNPGGRPKGSVGLKARLRRILTENSGSVAEEVCQAFVDVAKRSNKNAAVRAQAFAKLFEMVEDDIDRAPASGKVEIVIDTSRVKPERKKEDNDNSDQG
jgi:hypothetical protein